MITITNEILRDEQLDTVSGGGNFLYSFQDGLYLYDYGFLDKAYHLGDKIPGSAKNYFNNTIVNA